MTVMDDLNNLRLADYAERLRRLHCTVRPLLPAAQQDELLELAIGVGLLLPTAPDAPPCRCGHPHERHRIDPLVCLDCWHTPTAQPDSARHEHSYEPAAGSSPGEAPRPAPVL